MTLRNLSWADWVENLKRRNWTAVLCMVAFLLSVPVYQAMKMTALIREQQMLPAAFQEADFIVSIQREYMINISFSINFFVLSVLFGLLFAIQGFSWLYSRKKTDFYMSLPVSNKRRFLLLYLGGVFYYMAGYIAALLLSWFLGSLLGVMSLEAVGFSLIGLAANTVLFLAIYHTALFAVFLAGNMRGAILGCLFFLFYEKGIQVISEGYRNIYFRTYVDLGDRHSFLLSPFFNGLMMNQSVSLFKNTDAAIDAFSCFEGIFKPLLLLLVFVVLSAGLVYLAWRKRPTESYGHAIAVRGLRTPFKFFVLIPVSLFAGLLCGYASSDNPGFIIFGILCGILGGHCIFQILYESDLRAAWKKKWHIPAIAVVSLSVFASFYFDLTGFDRYVPSLEEAESVSVSLAYENSTLFPWYEDIGEDSMTYSSSRERMISQMNSPEEETIQAAGRMLTWNHEHYEELEETSSDRPISNWVIRYRLKNGKEISRTIAVDNSQVEDAISVIMNDERFHRTRYQIYAPEFEEHLDEMECFYFNGTERNFYTGDKDELLKVYQEEFKQYDYSLLKEKHPVGILKFTIACGKEMENEYEWNFPVYDSFAGTLALLEKDGAVKREEVGNFLETEEIASLWLINYVREGENGEIQWLEEPVRLLFTDKKDIERILPALYPGELYHSVDSDLCNPYDFYFDVEINYENDVLREKDTSAYFVVFWEKLPEDIQKRMKPSD